MNKEITTVSIDTETTGLQSGVHEIVSLSLIEYDKDFNVLNTFTTKIRPMRPELADPKALMVNKLSLAELKEEPTPSQIRNAFFQWHEEVLENKLIYPLGHNFIFDNGFLKIFFHGHYENVFHYHYDDTMVFARMLKRRGYIPQEQSCSLSKLCIYFGIEHDAHTSYGDALATIKLYKKLLSLI